MRNDKSRKERVISEETLIQLQGKLRQNNPYIRDFLQICPIPDEAIDVVSFVITGKQKPLSAGPRTYTKRHLTEVSVIMPEQVGSFDIVVKRR